MTDELYLWKMSKIILENLANLGIWSINSGGHLVKYKKLGSSRNSSRNVIVWGMKSYIAWKLQNYRYMDVFRKFYSKQGKKKVKQVHNFKLLHFLFLWIWMMLAFFQLFRNFRSDFSFYICGIWNLHINFLTQG